MIQIGVSFRYRTLKTNSADFSSPFDALIVFKFSKTSNTAEESERTTEAKQKYLAHIGTRGLNTGMIRTHDANAV